MSFHRVFDVVVLVATLVGGAAAVMLVITPFVFDGGPKRFQRGRWWLLSLVGVGIVLFLLEWLVIH
jgi:hypothetical protein